MTQMPGNPLVRHIRHLIGADLAEAPDADLLGRFVSQRDEDAVAELVRRYGALVFGVCRRVLTDAHTAEDVFQATFLVLVRKAASLDRRPLGGWLGTVAHRLALTARTQAARRRLHEGQAALSRPENTEPDKVDEVSLLVEEELQRLPERYRTPLVLCYLEGKTHEQVAQALGWPLGSTSRRLAQARDLLRERLRCRGLASLGCVGALLGKVAQAAPPVPLELQENTVRTALWFASQEGTGTAVCAEAVRLARTVLHTIALRKLKIVCALVLGVALLAGPAALLIGSVLGKPPATEPVSVAAEQEPQPAVRPAQGDPPKPDTPAPAEPAAARRLRVVVLDPRGKPLADANVHVGIWTEEKGFKARRDYQTNAEGIAQVELPKTFTILRLWASKKPFVTMFANWEQNELASAVGLNRIALLLSGKAFPAEYVFRLEPAVRAGGRILDEQGKPIAGARVEVSVGNYFKFLKSDGRARYSTWLAEGSSAATTDARGRWSIDNVPNNPQVELSLFVSHPDYVSDAQWGEAQKEAAVTTAMLRQETATLTLKRGVIVRGQVTDPTGQPIKDAIIVHGDDAYSSHLPCKFPTDAEGRYRLPALPPRETTLTVIARGWAPAAPQG